MNFFNRLLKNTTGLTYLEYALLAALIVAVGVGVVTTIGTGLNNRLANVNTAANPV